MSEQRKQEVPKPRKMLFKRPAKNKVYDILHHGAVYVCMGVTAAATVYLGYFGVKYFTEIKPNLKQEHLKKIAAQPDEDTAKTLTS